jgi:hypothetical protein
VGRAAPDWRRAAKAGLKPRRHEAVWLVAAAPLTDDELGAVDDVGCEAVFSSVGIGSLFRQQTHQRGVSGVGGEG